MKSKEAESVKEAHSTKDNTSSLPDLSLADRAAKIFSQMEESRNDRITETLDALVKKRKGSSQPQ